MRRRIIIPTILLACMLSAAARPAWSYEAASTPSVAAISTNGANRYQAYGVRGASASRQGDPSLATVAKRWDLRLAGDLASDRIELVGDGLRLTLVPGMPAVIVNGAVRRIDAAPRYESGELRIPSSVLSLLPSPRMATPRPAPQPMAAAPRRLSTNVTVVLDPGHGGSDPGAIGYRGIREKDVVLRVADLVRRELVARGVAVKMTRTGDTFPSLQDRADLANRTPGCIFVSIHANAAEDRSASGVETFVLTSAVSDSYRARRARGGYRVRALGKNLSDWGETQLLTQISRKARGQSLPLAQSVHTALVGVSNDDDRGIKAKNLHVLRESLFAPAILVELGFISHPASARRLASSTHQARQAKGIAAGLIAYIRAHDESASRPNNVRVVAR